MRRAGRRINVAIRRRNVEVSQFNRAAGIYYYSLFIIIIIRDVTAFLSYRLLVGWTKGHVQV